MKQGTRKNLKRGWILYVMLSIPLIWYFIFCYIPMGGIIVAFKDYNIYKGILESSWASGSIFKHFKSFLEDSYFWDVFVNTIIIGSANTMINFPTPIVLALVFNELKNKRFKKVTQTISYLPYFVSTVAIVNIVLILLSPSTGIINEILKGFGLKSIHFIMEPAYFVPIYVTTNMWRSIGWGTIIYIAAMANINLELYEAADIEGAGRFKKIWHITMPSIKPTIAILLILSMPGIVAADFETVLLLQRPQTFSTSDVIPTFIYRKGLLDARFDFGAAVGLVFAVLNTIIIYVSNKVSQKTAEVSIW